MYIYNNNYTYIIYISLLYFIYNIMLTRKINFLFCILYYNTFSVDQRILCINNYIIYRCVIIFSVFSMVTIKFIYELVHYIHMWVIRRYQLW